MTSEGSVVVRSGLEAFSFVIECLESGGNLRTSVGRVDDGIDKSAIGRDLGVEKARFVGIFKSLAIVIGDAAVENLYRAFGSHNRDLCRWPRKGKVIPHAL